MSEKTVRCQQQEDGCMSPREVSWRADSLMGRKMGEWVGMCGRQGRSKEWLEARELRKDE